MINKVNGVYHMDICLHGIRIRRSLYTSDKTQAQEMHDKTKAMMWEEHYLKKKPTPKWDEAVRKYTLLKHTKKSFNKDWAMMEYFNKHFDGKSLNDLDVEAVLAKADFGEVTKNRYRALIRSMYNLINEEMHLNIPLPILRFTKETPREEYLTQSEYEYLRSELPVGVQRVVALAVETGLRKSNLLQLNKKTVDSEAKVAYFPTTATKNGKPVALPLSDKAMKILEECNYEIIFTQTDYKIFKEAARRIGKPYLRFHDLRHTFATHKAQAGVPLEIVGKLLGHSSLQSTERYRHYCLDELRKYVNGSKEQETLVISKSGSTKAVA